MKGNKLKIKQAGKIFTSDDTSNPMVLTEQPKDSILFKDKVALYGFMKKFTDDYKSFLPAKINDRKFIMQYIVNQFEEFLK